MWHTIKQIVVVFMYWVGQVIIHVLQVNMYLTETTDISSVVAQFTTLCYIANTYTVLKSIGSANIHITYVLLTSPKSIS